MFKEIYVPPGQETQDRFPYHEALQYLPLSEATSEKNALTGVTEFVAPEGFAFEISGEFTLDSLQNDIVIWGPPQESAALSARHDFDDQDDDALPLVETFTAQRLSIAIDNRGYKRGETRAEELSPAEKQRVEITLLGQVNAWYETGLQEYVWQKSQDSHTYVQDLIAKPLSILMWQAPIAIGNLDASYVKLVPYAPPAPDIAVMTISEAEKGLQVVSDGLTAQDYYEFTKDYIRFSEGMTEEDKVLALMRHKRETGWPFADDPLHDVWIVRSEKHPTGSLDIDRLAAKALASCAPPPSYSEAQRLQDQKIQKIFRQKRIAELRSTIAVIAGTDSLKQLVAQNTGDQWIERELGGNHDDPF